MALGLTRFLSLLASHNISAIGTYRYDDPRVHQIYVNFTGDQDELIDEVYRLYYSTFKSGYMPHIWDIDCYLQNLDRGSHGPLFAPEGFFSGLQGTPNYPAPDQYLPCLYSNGSFNIQATLAADEGRMQAEEERMTAERQRNKIEALNVLHSNGFNVTASYKYDYNGGLMIFFNHTVEDQYQVNANIRNLLHTSEVDWSCIFSFAYFNWSIAGSAVYSDEFDIPDGFFSGQQRVLEVCSEDPSTPQSVLEEEHRQLHMKEKLETELLVLIEYSDDDDHEHVMAVLPLFLNNARALPDAGLFNTLVFGKQWW